MSSSSELHQEERSAPRSRRGQSLVEFALVLPLLLVLLLGAVDFGRVFFGWVALTNASRIGADYAASHPDAWALGNTAQQLKYEELVTAEDLIGPSGATRCAMTVGPPTFPDGGRDLGDPARVELSCDFDLVTPFLQPLLGRPITVVATSTFPIRRGCANCDTTTAGPQPPPANNCRQVPTMVGQSVDGARAAWLAAGFTGPLDPSSADGWRTVSFPEVRQGGNPGCSLPQAFFSSSVFVFLEGIAEPGPGQTCLTVPNVRGATVAAARQSWTAAGFDADAFTPPAGSDDQIVSVVTYDPPGATHGECQEPDLAIEVQFVPPPPPPPDPPCKVPSFVNTLRADAAATWGAAGFTGPIAYEPDAAWTVIREQTMVGGNYVSCAAPMTLVGISE